MSSPKCRINTKTDNDTLIDNSDSENSIIDNDNKNSITDNDSSKKKDFDITNSSKRYNSSFNDSSLTCSPQKSPSHKSSSSSVSISFKHSFSLKIVVIVVVVAVISTLNILYSIQDNNQSIQILQHKRTDIIQKFRESVISAKMKFQNQTLSTWNAFQSQVEEVIYETTKVSIVILLGNETNTIKCFAKVLGNLCSKALGSNNYLTLNTGNIGNDHGEIITKWKPEILINKVVIIEDLLSMNSESAKALHNFCDKENPLVSMSFYIITIISNDYKGSNRDKFVEDVLTDKFSKTIDLDILAPLITRIMDGPIIPVISESNIKGKHNIKEC